MTIITFINNFYFFAQTIQISEPLMSVLIVTVQILSSCTILPFQVLTCLTLIITIC